MDRQQAEKILFQSHGQDDAALRWALAEIDRLQSQLVAKDLRIAELNHLAHGWMVAHDIRASGRTDYKSPSPVDLPESLQRERDLQSQLDEAQTKLDAVQRGYFQEMKHACEAESRLDGWKSLAQRIVADLGKIDLGVEDKAHSLKLDRIWRDLSDAVSDGIETLPAEAEQETDDGMQ